MEDSGAGPSKLNQSQPKTAALKQVASHQWWLKEMAHTGVRKKKQKQAPQKKIKKDGDLAGKQRNT